MKSSEFIPSFNKNFCTPPWLIQVRAIVAPSTGSEIRYKASAGTAIAEAWRPWRGYAVFKLWLSLETP